LGAGMALGLAEAGADVALADVIEMDETKEQIEKMGRRVVCVKADLSK
jgi:2-dehydro-3-deoxy-D-gluconate 5-dehydrogenase